MDKVAIDKLVRLCLRECLQTTRLTPEVTHAIHQLMHPSIRNLIYIFIEAAEKTHLKS
jgi:hypothetical protein